MVTDTPRSSNGEKRLLWQTIAVLMTVITILVGTVWGITWGNTTSRLCAVEDKVVEQQDRLARIETKIDILLERRD